MGECGDSAFGGGVALCLRLAHPVARGRNIDNAGSLPEMRRKQLGQIERRRDANTQRILELLITALVDSLHQRQRVVDEIINTAGFADHFLGKIFQNRLVREIPHVVISGRFVDHINLYALLAEFFSNAFTNSMRAAGYYGCFLYVVHNLTSPAIDLWGRLSSVVEKWPSNDLWGRLFLNTVPSTPVL